MFKKEKTSALSRFHHAHKPENSATDQKPNTPSICRQQSYIAYDVVCGRSLGGLGLPKRLHVMAPRELTRTCPGHGQRTISCLYVKKVSITRTCVLVRGYSCDKSILCRDLGAAVSLQTTPDLISATYDKSSSLLSLLSVIRP